ncbi:MULTISPECIES: nuclear transport factor 2 family protein [unclassified Streptomyces]|uniref:nuclear transport factor 2 family protein n=1 Tax=unclassified Streptomyces TaxID=2593676 RepID=UPI003826E546
MGKQKTRQRFHGGDMPTVDHQDIITEWIAASNTHDAGTYLKFFTEDAVLDDPSVGRTFDGVAGIKEYFDAYFIGYRTTTRLQSVTPVPAATGAGYLHVEVDFTGDFPGGHTGGTFDITFSGDKIAHIRADLT